MNFLSFTAVRGRVLPDSLMSGPSARRPNGPHRTRGVFCLMVELEPSPMNVSALATAAVSLNQEPLAVTTLETLAT